MPPRNQPTITAEQSARITATLKPLNAKGPTSTSAGAAASWDGVHATDMAKRMGMELVEGSITTAARAASTPVSTGAGSDWDDVVTQANATRGLKHSQL